MDKDFLNFLLDFVSDERRELFNDLVEKRTRYATVVLEDIFQPHNASAVLRSCDCFGIQDVHIIENRNSWEFNRDVEQGSSKWLSINRYGEKDQNSKECIDSLKSKGYKIVATTPHTDMTISELPLDEPIALVLGTEFTGVSPEVMEAADYKVKIPMYGFTESFNISVAAAVCMNVIRQRLDSENQNYKITDDERTQIMLLWCEKTLKHFDKYFDTFQKLGKG